MVKKTRTFYFIVLVVVVLISSIFGAYVTFEKFSPSSTITRSNNGVCPSGSVAVSNDMVARPADRSICCPSGQIYNPLAQTCQQPLQNTLSTISIAPQNTSSTVSIATHPIK